MTDHSFTDLIVQCPSCLVVNHLVTSDLGDDEHISCSHCHAPLGEWGVLKLRVADQDDAAPRSA